MHKRNVWDAIVGAKRIWNWLLEGESKERGIISNVSSKNISNCFTSRPMKTNMNMNYIKLENYIKLKVNFRLAVFRPAWLCAFGFQATWPTQKCDRAYMKFVADVRGEKMFNVKMPKCQNCSTWQAILHHMAQLFVMWSNLIMWSNDKLLHICNVEQFVITPGYNHDSQFQTLTKGAFKDGFNMKEIISKWTIKGKMQEKCKNSLLVLSPVIQMLCHKDTIQVDRLRRFSQHI